MFFGKKRPNAYDVIVSGRLEISKHMMKVQSEEKKNESWDTGSNTENVSVAVRQRWRRKFGEKCGKIIKTSKIPQVS